MLDCLRRCLKGDSSSEVQVERKSYKELLEAPRDQLAVRYRVDERGRQEFTLERLPRKYSWDGDQYLLVDREELGELIRRSQRAMAEADRMTQAQILERCQRAASEEAIK